VETFLIVLLSATILQGIDFFSIQEIVKARGEKAALTILPLRVVRRPVFLGVAKIIFGLLTGVVYVGVLLFTADQNVWQHYMWIRDLFLGTAVLALIASTGVRVFLSWKKTTSTSDADSHLSYEASFLLFVASMIGIFGLLLIFFAQSLLLLGASATLFVASFRRRGKRKKDVEKEAEESEQEVPAKELKAIFVGFAVLLSAIVIWGVNSSEDFWIPSDYSSNAIETESPHLVFQSDGFTFRGIRENGASDVPDSGFLWYSGNGGYLDKFQMQSSAGNRSIVISDYSGNLLSTSVQTIRFSVLSLDDCTRLNLYRPDLAVRIVGKNTTTFLRIDKNFGVNISFDILPGPERTRAYVTSLSDKNSAVHLTCESPTLYLDDEERTYNGTVYVYVENFDQLDISMRVVEDTSILVSGTNVFHFENVKGRIDDVKDSMLSSRGQYDKVEGHLHILSADEVELKFDSRSFSWVTQSLIVPFELNVSGGVIYVLSANTGSPLLPATYSVYSCEPEQLRVVFMSLTILVAFSTIVAIMIWPIKGKKPDDENSANERDLGAFWMKTFALFGAVALVGLSMYGTLGTQPVGYYLNRTPVDFEIWVEEGVDLNLVKGTMTLFEYEADQLLGLSVHSIDYHLIPPDGKDKYYDWDSEMWGPAGLRAHDTVLMNAGVNEAFHITFLKGSGDGFIGKSNRGASIAMFLQGNELPLSVLGTLIHELGHSLDMDHNIHSRMMTGNRDITEPRYQETYSVSEDYGYRGVDLFGSARNGTVQGYPDWGEMVFQLLNRRGSDESNSTFNVCIFLDEEANSIRQVVYRRNQYPNGNIIETVTIDYAPSNWHFWSFSLSERVYILNSVSGGDALEISNKWSS
jgi:hypothetical protein